MCSCGRQAHSEEIGSDGELERNLPNNHDENWVKKAAESSMNLEHDLLGIGSLFDDAAFSSLKDITLKDSRVYDRKLLAYRSHFDTG